MLGESTYAYSVVTGPLKLAVEAMQITFGRASPGNGQFLSTDFNNRAHVPFLLAVGACKQTLLHDDVAAVAQVTHSALVLACLKNHSLDRARVVFRSMQSRGQTPTRQAYNALINAYGREGRLGETASVVADMVAAGLQPDAYTFAAALAACQHAHQADVGFEIYACVSGPLKSPCVLFG